jgi:hypothetical protein
MDVSAEIERIQRELNGSWGEIRVPGGGTITRPVTIERGQTLILPPDKFRPATDPYGSFNHGYFRMKSNSALVGSGPNTIVYEHDGRVMVKPYDMIGATQPPYYNLRISDIQFRGLAGTNDVLDPGAVVLGNAQGGVVERCHFVALHGEGVIMGGPPPDGYVACPGRNQVVRDCVFLGGTPDDHLTGGVHVAIINCINAQVQNNMMLRPPGGAAAIDIEPNDDLDKIENYQITGNLIDLRRNIDNGTTQWGFYPPVGTVDWGNYPDYLVETADQRYDDTNAAFSAAILVQSRQGVQTGPGLIANNVIVGGWCRPGDTTITASSSTGILLGDRGCHGAHVHGNTLYYMGQTPLHIDGHHHYVHDNVLYNASANSDAIRIIGRHNNIVRNWISMYTGNQGNAITEIDQGSGLTGYNYVADNDVGYAFRGGSLLTPPTVFTPAVSTSSAGRGGHKNRSWFYDPLESVNPDVQWP